MAAKPEFKQDVVDRLTRIEKILSERFTRSFDRLPIDAMSENKEIEASRPEPFAASLGGRTRVAVGSA